MDPLEEVDVRAYLRMGREGLEHVRRHYRSAPGRRATKARNLTKARRYAARQRRAHPEWDQSAIWGERAGKLAKAASIAWDAWVADLALEPGRPLPTARLDEIPDRVERAGRVVAVQRLQYEVDAAFHGLRAARKQVAEAKYKGPAAQEAARQQLVAAQRRWRQVKRRSEKLGAEMVGGGSLMEEAGTVDVRRHIRRAGDKWVEVRGHKRNRPSRMRGLARRAAWRALDAVESPRTKNAVGRTVRGTQRTIDLAVLGTGAAAAVRYARPAGRLLSASPEQRQRRRQQLRQAVGAAKERLKTGWEAVHAITDEYQGMDARRRQGDYDYIGDPESPIGKLRLARRNLRELRTQREAAGRRLRQLEREQGDAELEKARQEFRLEVEFDGIDNATRPQPLQVYQFSNDPEAEELRDFVIPELDKKIKEARKEVLRQENMATILGVAAERARQGRPVDAEILQKTLNRLPGPHKATREAIERLIDRYETEAGLPSTSQSIIAAPPPGGYTQAQSDRLRSSGLGREVLQRRREFEQAYRAHIENPQERGPNYRRSGDDPPRPGEWVTRRRPGLPGGKSPGKPTGTMRTEGLPGESTYAFRPSTEDKLQQAWQAFRKAEQTFYNVGPAEQIDKGMAKRSISAAQRELRQAQERVGPDALRKLRETTEALKSTQNTYKMLEKQFNHAALEQLPGAERLARQMEATLVHIRRLEEQHKRDYNRARPVLMADARLQAAVNRYREIRAQGLLEARGDLTPRNYGDVMYEDYAWADGLDVDEIEDLIEAELAELLDEELLEAVGSGGYRARSSGRKPSYVVRYKTHNTRFSPGQGSRKRPAVVGRFYYKGARRKTGAKGWSRLGGKGTEFYRSGPKGRGSLGVTRGMRAARKAGRGGHSHSRATGVGRKMVNQARRPQLKVYGGLKTNRSGNARAGQSYRTATIRGKRAHVYGSGANRRVVVLKRKPTSGRRA